MIVNLPTEEEIAAAKLDADMERTVTSGPRRVDSGTSSAYGGDGANSAYGSFNQPALMSPPSLLEERPSTGERERYQREWQRVDGNGGEDGQSEFVKDEKAALRERDF